MKYVIVGNGVAGTTAAENIRNNDPAGEIAIVTEEETPFYYRVRLPDFLGGEVDESDLIAKKKEWYEEKNISLRLATEISGGSLKDGILHTAENETLRFDRLLLANGSRPNIPPIANVDLKGVFTLHSIRDCKDIARYSEGCRKAVIIGGGLLGLEAANGLVKRGLEVLVVEYFPRLLPRQLDHEGGERLQNILKKKGFSFKLGAVTKAIEGNRQVEGVTLMDGSFSEADIILIAAGANPRLELARQLELDCCRGIRVDERMQTSHPDVYAAGDSIEFKEKTFGIWPAAMQQGKIAGANIAGGKDVYTGTVLSNILKVTGIDLASAGEIDADNRYEAKITSSENVFKKAVIDKKKVIGCIMLGDRKNFSRINRAISSGENILAELDTLLAD